MFFCYCLAGGGILKLESYSNKSLSFSAVNFKCYATYIYIIQHGNIYISAAVTSRCNVEIGSLYTEANFKPTEEKINDLFELII